MGDERRGEGGFEIAGIFSVVVMVLVLLLVLGGVGAWYVALQHERALQARDAALHLERQQRAAEAAGKAKAGEQEAAEALDLEAMTKEELWALGCERFGWDERGEEGLDEVTAEDLRAWLREDLKWEDVGDHGYSEPPYD